MIRIAVTGPEATGKSTLAQALASHFNTVWCPEYSRTYFDTHSHENYSLWDVVEINRGQMELSLLFEQKYKDQQIVFFDTDPFVNRIWAQRKFGICPSEIMTTAKAPFFDYYLLCFPDIPWEYDPLREDQENRSSLFSAYEMLLSDTRTPFAVVKGLDQQRVDNALNIIALNFNIYGKK